MAVPKSVISNVGNIILPDSAIIELCEGIVVDIGPRVQFLKVGDEICWDQHSEYKMTVNENEKFILVNENRCTMYIRPVLPSSDSPAPTADEIETCR